jgi:hypothetical protein
MARIGNQFRLGFRLGRLKGRLEATLEHAGTWNGTVRAVSDVISRGSANVDIQINGARKAYEDALFEQQLEAEVVEFTPASREDRKALRKQKRAWLGDFEDARTS